MGNVIAGMTMSLDGFVQDQHGSVSRLYPDFVALQQSDLLQESMRTTGAVVMGRHSYDMAQGDFTGYEYQVPIFVVTHSAPATVAKGENGALQFHFVTDGLASAITQAKAAAGDKDVTVIGGAQIIQQGIQQGLFDELEVGIAPVLLGAGLRLFEHLGTEPLDLEQTQTTEAAGVTFLRYRMRKRA